MLAVHETCSHCWNEFWELLEEKECLWAKQTCPDTRTKFEQTIESMLVTSIPASPMSRLRDVWSSLHLEGSLSNYWDNISDRWWNLFATLTGPDQFTDEEATHVVEELWMSQVDEAKSDSPVPEDTLSAAPELLRWLKYTALCTVWQFSNAWSCYTDTLPREVIQELREELFSLAMLVLLRQLR